MSTYGGKSPQMGPINAPSTPQTGPILLSVPTFREADPNDDIEVMSVLSFHRDPSRRPSMSSSVSSSSNISLDGDSSSDEEGGSTKRDHHHAPSASTMRLFSPTTTELLCQIQRSGFATRPPGFPRVFRDEQEWENAYIDLEGSIWSLRGGLKLIAGNLIYVAFQAQQRADHFRFKCEEEHKISTIVTIMKEAEWEDDGLVDESEEEELVKSTRALKVDEKAEEKTETSSSDELNPVVWEDAVQVKEFRFPDEIFHVFATLQFMCRKISNLDTPEYRQFPEYDISLEVEFFQRASNYQRNLLWISLKNLESSMRGAVEYFGSYDPAVKLDAERLVAFHNQIASDIKLYQWLTRSPTDLDHQDVQRVLMEYLDPEVLEGVQCVREYV